MKRFKYMALAALVAFAACDEGTDVVVTPDVTGDIAGVVTIEGAAVSGVTVALSSGATTTTNGSGAYSFSGVAAGAYTITISGFAADATFSSTSKAATIVTTGQVATVNFDGAYVRTSAILGSVAAGGKNLPGVTVTLGSSSTQTDANGNYSFSGLRAGTYTLTVSGFNASQYAFATSTQNVTVGVGESKVVSFAGQLLATSTISGTLYIDGNGNFTKDTGEPAVAKAGIQVALEIAVTDTIFTLTDANGAYSFGNLAEGTYKVILLPQAAIPGAFTQAGDPRYQAVATSGATTTVNFPFIVTTQYVQVYGMRGVDNKSAGSGGPIANWTMNLYPTEVDATGSTFPLVTANSKKTDANGLVTFKFLRSADYSPNAAKVDGIVFAKVAAPSAGYAVNGETIIEIPWSPLDSMVMAPDTFDALYGRVFVKVHSAEIDFDTLAGWTFEMRSDKDSIGGGSNTWTNFSNVKGDLVVDVDLALLASIRGGTAVTFPDTLWFKLAAFQGGAAGHGFTQVPTPTAGSAQGSYLKYIWDGTTGPGDTVQLGKSLVKYTDSDYSFRVHREQDDSTGVTATFTTGDGFDDVTLMNVALYTVASSGTKTQVVGSPIAATVGTGVVTYLNMDNTKNYEVRARSTHGGYSMLNDTAIAFTVDGSDQTYSNRTLYRGTGATATWTPATFAYKSNTNMMAGNVLSRKGASPVKGAIVSVQPAAGNIQGTAAKLDTTDAAGAYSVAGLREGPYEVSVSTGDSAWTFLRTLKTSSVPSSGSANNATVSTASRDLQGYGVTGTSNFEAYRTDATWSGLVVNDRDTDLTTIDPGEALAGAVINLYRDDDTGTAGMDTLAATATTDANGAYSFTGLTEGRYTAVWASGSPTIDTKVLRSINTSNVATVSVTGITLFGGPVKNTAANLPAWSYGTSAGSNLTDANFTFVFSNTVVQGSAKTAAAVPVAGMTITMQRCFTSTANGGGLNTLTNVSGPQPDDGVNTTCTVFFTGLTNTVTDASGNFQFSNLPEGVYKVTPQPVTAGFAGFTPAGGALNQPGLYLTVGSGDIETLAFTIS